MIYSALIGENTNHSKSHLLFSELERQFGVEHSHIKMNVKKNNLKDTILCLEKLGFSFVNVTFPYKISCIKYLDNISEKCKAMKSVNTIRFVNGKKIGDNIDGIAAIKSIELKSKKIKFSDRILVFGAGGVARSIIYELLNFTKNVTVINRDIQENNELKIIFPEIQVSDFSENLVELINNHNIIVNATSVGNDSSECIIPVAVWEQFCTLNGKFFFDVVLNPTITQFLREAENKGARVCSGLYMMIFQLVDLFCEYNHVDSNSINVEELFIYLDNLGV